MLWPTPTFGADLISQFYERHGTRNLAEVLMDIKATMCSGSRMIEGEPKTGGSKRWVTRGSVALALSEHVRQVPPGREGLVGPGSAAQAQDVSPGMDGGDQSSRCRRLPGAQYPPLWRDPGA